MTHLRICTRAVFFSALVYTLPTHIPERCGIFLPGSTFYPIVAIFLCYRGDTTIRALRDYEGEYSDCELRIEPPREYVRESTPDVVAICSPINVKLSCIYTDLLHTSTV